MTVKLHPPERHLAIIRRLHQTGALTVDALHRTSADFAGRGKYECEEPLFRVISSPIMKPVTVEGEKYWDGERWKARPMPGQIDWRRRHTDIKVRCRKCPSCLKARSILWRIRATEEIALCYRTWFCTFTLSPASHAVMLNRALLSASRRGNPTLENDISSDDMFLERHREISREFTLFFKRLRKQGFKFRYLLVCEAHKSGLPHYHALMHDCSITAPLVHRAIGKQWRLGFYQAKLVPEGDISAVNYCTKYIAKSAISRVRASAGYGQAAKG